MAAPGRAQYPAHSRSVRRARCQGDFFTLGWVAERHPALIKRIVSEGHELASHGYKHVRVTRQSAAEFRADITRTKALLEDLGGVAVQGYRAASYSIGAGNLWALAELEQAGYRYSSSIYPIRHDLYERRRRRACLPIPRTHRRCWKCR